MYVPSSGSRQGFLVQCGHQNHATSSAEAIHNSYPICWCLAEGIDRIYGIYFRILVKSWCNANVDIKMLQPLHLQISYSVIVIAVCTQFFWGLFTYYDSCCSAFQWNWWKTQKLPPSSCWIVKLPSDAFCIIIPSDTFQLAAWCQHKSLFTARLLCIGYIVKLTIQWNWVNLFWSERLEWSKQHQSLA